MLFVSIEEMFSSWNGNRKNAIIGTENEENFFNNMGENQHTRTGEIDKSVVKRDHERYQIEINRIILF